jgi:thiol:disulfide interchange protein DsbA
MFHWKKWLGLFMLAAACAAPAQAASEGREYTLMNPAQPTEGGNKVEVIEFFWYGCPHCYSLEPALNKWVRSLPGDVVFKRVPAIPTPRWAPLARTFYTLDAMGELERLHSEVFDAIHRDNVKLDRPEVQQDWIARKGVDAKKFNDTWNSFTVQSKVNRAAQMTQSYRIDSVPTLVVDGKYKTSVSAAGGNEQLIAVLNELVAKARGARGKAK